MKKLHSLLQRHSTLFALAAVLAAFFAAPYLVPEDPDSGVFRYGTLSAILLLGCMIPVRKAFAEHSLRSLLYGAAFAFIYALCLGVGSELSVYQELLSGTGSLIRRLAVPLMVTPFFAALVSFFFEHAQLRRKEKELSIPYWGFFLLFAACYAAFLLAMFPGIINYDFEHEILQYQSGVFEASHPVFHTLLLGFLYQLGETVFGSFTAGAATYSVFQLLSLAAMYAAVCRFVQRRVPFAVTLILTACFALLPFHGVLAISTVKDAFFTGLCALICISLWEIAEDPAAFASRRGRQIRFVLLCLGTALVRHNAVFAFLPACIAVLVLCRGCRARAALICAAAVLLSTAVPKSIEIALDAEKTPSSELMSVPCQQLMRTAEWADISEEEYAAINEWFSNATHRYRPHCADPAKGGNFDFERYQANPGEFWSMYFDYAQRFPKIYLEAFLQNCAGIWNPDDISHAHSLDGEEWDYVYARTVNNVPEEAGTIEERSFIPALRDLIKSTMHHSRHEQIPLISHLFRPSFYVFALLLGVLLVCCRRQGRLALCTLPVWGVFLSILFSAGVIVRYAYPIMTCVPPLLALLLCAGRPKETR